MLVVGDHIINNFDKNFKVKKTEVIYHGNADLRFAMMSLGLKSPEVLSKYTTRFIKDNNVYLFHNAEKNEGLHMMMLATFSKKKCFKLSPLLYEFIIRQAKVNYINSSVSDWHENIKVMLQLRDKLDYTIYSKPDFMKEIDYLSDFILDWVENLPNIRVEKYYHRPYDIYPLYDILNVITKSKKPLYTFCNLNMNGQKHSISAYNFKMLSYQDKIDCVLEKVYASVINDYIIRNELMDPKDNVHKIMSLCKRSLMNNINNKVIDTAGNKEFKNFIVLNYNQIIDAIDYEFYYLFNEAVKYNVLEKIKN